jgi:ADP-heptose:LPS heptosyltransferase
VAVTPHPARGRDALPAPGSGDRSGPRGARRGRACGATIVAYRALGLGDLLTAVPALRGLRAAFPDRRLVLAAPAVLAPLAELSGAVDEVADTAELAPLPAALDGLELAVNLHGAGPQSTALLRAAGPRRLVAFGDGVSTWRDGEHEVERWCRLLAEHGIPADPGRLDLPVPRRPVASAARGATLIHPGAASAARRWPAERWAAVARAERAAGRRVIVTAGVGEEELARGIGPVAETPGLLDLAALVAAADRVLSGDTGVAHLATALGTPSVVLFGPTPPAEWGPPADRPRHRVLWRGGRGDPHGEEVDPGLLAIEVDDVLAALADGPVPAPTALS